MSEALEKKWEERFGLVGCGGFFHCHGRRRRRRRRRGAPRLKRGFTHLREQVQRRAFTKHTHQRNRCGVFLGTVGDKGNSAFFPGASLAFSADDVSPPSPKDVPKVSSHPNGRLFLTYNIASSVRGGGKMIISMAPPRCLFPARKTYFRMKVSTLLLVRPFSSPFSRDDNSLSIALLKSY